MACHKSSPSRSSTPRASKAQPGGDRIEDRTGENRFADLTGVVREVPRPIAERRPETMNRHGRSELLQAEQPGLGARGAPPQPEHAPKREPPSIERIHALAGDRIGLGDGVAIGPVGMASAPPDPGGTARSATGPRAINVQLTSSTTFSGSTKARTIIGVTPMRYLHRSQRPTWRRPNLSTSQSRSSR